MGDGALEIQSLLSIGQGLDDSDWSPWLVVRSPL